MVAVVYPGKDTERTINDFEGFHIDEHHPPPPHNKDQEENVDEG